MLGATTTSLSHPPQQPSEPPAPASSSGKGGAFLFSAQPSPALSADSSGSGSSTIRGTSEGRRHNVNRWSGSASSLSRSNSDSSTLSKVRSQHAHSVSVPHIVTIRAGGPNQASRTKISPSPVIESSNAKINDKIPVAPHRKTSPPLAQSSGPPPLPPDKPRSNPQTWLTSKSKVQPQQPPIPRKTREQRSQSQRAMLSSALKKANTAVLLDNAGNVEGAMGAYRDACSLLQQAMARAELEGDRAQLQSIHDTYINRIEQLRAMSPRMGSNEKELPARPLTQEFIDEIDSIREEDEQQFDEDNYYVEDEDLSMYQLDTTHATSSQRKYPRKAFVPPRRDSLLIGAVNSESKYYKNDIPLPPLKVSTARLNPPSPIAESFPGDDIFERDTESRLSIDRDSFRFSSPSPTRLGRDHIRRSASTGSNSSRVSSQRHSSIQGHSRGGSEVSTSWLNTIDESGGSVSGDSIEGGEWGRRPAFDAELDAAVEAAYDDDEEYDLGDYEVDGLLIMKNPDRLVSSDSPEAELERAKERVRQSEREVQLEIEQDEERRKRIREENVYGVDLDFFDDGDGENEVDDMMEDLTRDYSLDDFEFDLHTKSSLPRDPRESSSSSMSASTWVSSVASKKSSLMSHGYTSGTALHSVAELPPSRPPSVPPPPPPPPPLQSEVLPLHLVPKSSLDNMSMAPLVTSTPPPSSPPRTLPPPPPISPGPPGDSSGKGLQNSASLNAKQSGVRMRRLSGLVAGPLMIETATTTPLTLPTTGQFDPSIAQGPSSTSQSLTHVVGEDRAENTFDPERNAASSPAPSTETQDIPPPPVPLKTSGTIKSFSVSPLPGSENAGLSLMPQPVSGLSQESITPRSASPARFASKMANLPGLRQINSSSSLKNLNKVSTPELEATSPITPGLGGFFGSTGSGTNLRLVKAFAAQTPAPPTPGGMVPMTPTVGYGFSPSAGGLASGGLHLFDSKLHSPTTPGSPSSLIPNPPVPLEPCPTEPLSRPYWLMRCLYQTIAHVRGGYISARLFVPKDVWLQKGVKIKAMDDKISACDLVSAALAKLSIIQNSDPDLNAIFEEMQSLEGVLDRVQVMLSKKLGSEVGATGAAALYGTASNGDGTGIEGGKASVGKSYLSWRKLRSKNSSTTLGTTFGPDASFDTPNLPMATPRTGNDQQKPPERNLKNVSFTGPNAAYIAALAKVFDAAQVLDRLPPIDAGKLSRKTQIGLELSHRHASEFFGFYICRFVLADVSMLLDKFLKKGTEWVGS